jgi:L-iditol 2-dehydrogenase
MRAAVQTEKGRIEIREIAAPEPGPGELVVRVRAALTCGTDRKILERGHVKLAPPLVMGHEFSGEVERTGAGTPFHEGDAVLVGVSGPCGECAACASGASNRCVRPERAWGAFAEMIRVPRRVVDANVFRKPPSLPFREAALLDPLACVVHGLDRLTPLPEEILVVGAGAIGLLWIAAARAAGIRRVGIVGLGAGRLAVARRWGAEVFDRDAGEKAPATAAVVECVGTPDAWQEAFAATVPGGRTLFFGGCAPGTAVALDAAKIHYGETTILGSYHYRPEEAARAVEWLVAGGLDLDPLFSGPYGLDELPALIARSAGRDGIKHVITP